MDNPELTKEWFVTHEGQQFGPVSLDDLRYEAERGELNPRLDMVWKDGMDGWMPSGKIAGLFEKNTEAEIVEQKKERAAGTEYQPEESKKKRLLMEGKWGGTNRFSYLFFNFIFPTLWVLAVVFGSGFLADKLGESLINLIVAGLMVVPFIIGLYVTINRFGNLGMSRWWFLGLFVPILNIWVYSRLFACPEGYADHKKLDGLGWLLAIIYWFLVLLIIAAVGFLAFEASKIEADKITPEAIREMVEGYGEKFGIELPEAEVPETTDPAPESP